MISKFVLQFINLIFRELIKYMNQKDNISDVFLKKLKESSDIEMTILELAQEIIKFTNSKSEIIHLPALKEAYELKEEFYWIWDTPDPDEGHLRYSLMETPLYVQQL